MKKLKKSLPIAFLIVAPITFINAQNDYANSSKKPLFISYSQVRKLYNAVIIENKSGVRAMKDFSKRFTNPSNVNWFAESNSISASFIKDGIKYSVLYNNNGHWIRTVKTYDETRLPANIRELVKRSKYFDNDIRYVWEVQEGGFLYYVIHLQDKKTVNEILVYEGEITLFKTYIIQ